MLFEPSLHFHPKQAWLNLELNGEEPRKRRITLTAELAGQYECEVITASRRSLRSANWTIYLVEKDYYSEQAKAEQAIGLLSHHPANEYHSESCLIEVAVDPTTFQTVYEILRKGKLPSVISVSSRDLAYGPDPDGRTKIWDIDADINLYIAEISITTPLVVESEPSEEEFETPIQLATSADAQAIRQEITTVIVQMQSKIVGQTRWLVGIGVGILILLTAHFK
jgi:hypothetical protein